MRWFWLVFAVTAVFQIMRLQQDTAAGWLTVDYVMRLTALGLLAFSPVRPVVFCREALSATYPQLLIRVVAAGAAVILTLALGWVMWRTMPDLSLGAYPKTRGWLYAIDLTAGVALTAVHEELVFRRLARLAFSGLGSGVGMIATTSVLFGLFHWWTGPWNVLAVALTGAVLMMLYRSVGALWPVILVHYCADLYAFW